MYQETEKEEAKREFRGASLILKFTQRRQTHENLTYNFITSIALCLC